VWSGAASTLWSVNGNWSSGGSPAGDSNADLVFPASGVTRYTSKDDLALSTAIHSIAFNDRGFDLTAPPGQAIVLDTDITATNTSGGNIIDIGISLATDADHTLSVAGDGVLDINRRVLDGSATKSLIKAGVGELVFVADNNGYKNATHIQAGTLTALGEIGTGDPTTSAMVVDAGATLNCQQQGFASVGSLSGSGNVIVGSPTNPNALDVGQDNTSTTFSGVISGTAYVDKYGTGTLTLSAANTYSELTNIYQGTLRLGSDNALAPGAVMNLVPNYGGTLDLANHNVTIAALVGGAGTENVNLGTGTLTINAILPFSSSYNGVISGTGSLVKSGSGTQLLGGNNTYTGSTMINGGTLEIDGNQIQSAVIVAAGAVLNGTGIIGSVTVFGTLQPGSAANPDGILSVHGDVTFSGFSAIFAVELDGTGVGQYSQLSTAGTVDLGTFTSLDLTIGYAATSGDTFAGVITSASLVGTLGFVPPGFQDSYSVTDLDLSIQ
jgi:autotransporter-associated beta strand protein